MSADPDLKTRIEIESNAALRAGNRERRGTLSLILAAIKQFEVDTRKPAHDPDVLKILDKLSKQRRESIEQFSAANRQNLVDRERRELEVIGEFLPPPMDMEEIETLINEAIDLSKASAVKDMGRVMNELRPRLQGRTDMSAVSARVKARLAGSNN